MLLKISLIKKVFAFFLIIATLSQSFLWQAVKTQAQTSETQTNDLGSETIENPEFYDKVSKKTVLKIIETKETDPKIIKQYDKPITGFSLEIGSLEDFQDVAFKVKKGDDSYTDPLSVKESDTLFGDKDTKATNQKISELYTFSEGIKELQIFYIGERNIKINEIKNLDPFPLKTDIKPAAYASTSAEREYKEKLFQKLGFNIVTREEWGAPTTSTWTPKVVDVSRVVIHHTATSVDMAKPANTVKAIYNYHYYRCANNNGSYSPSKPDCDEVSELWQDIGYNYLIDPYGTIYEGRSGGNGVVGAHAIPNTGSIGISLLGTYTNQLPTTAALNSLTKLISALSLLDDFKIDWHDGLYGHRDYMSTACPGNPTYTKLPQISTGSKNLYGSNVNLKSVHDLTKSLTENREILESSGKAQLILDISNSTPLIKEKLLTASRGIEKVTQKGNTLFYTINKSQMNQVITETLLIDPSTKIQPDFIYKPEGWTQETTRSIPDDYSSTTHWNLEKVKAPEAWKDLGGCMANDSCGGDPSVVVAVVDTGVAHENYNYDAGTDSSYTTSFFSGLGVHVEYPQDSTPDGTFVDSTSYKGYERNYKINPELSDVNFVSPYDVVQDYFCFIRDLESDTSKHCNSAELAKINHANDDHGHGTFVTTIIAGKTGDTSPNKVVGIAHNVSIMPIKVFLPNDSSMCQDSLGNQDPSCSDSNYDYRVAGSSYIISEGIYHAINNNADVINLSLRGIGTDPYMETAIQEAIANDIVVVAASGNDNDDLSRYFPASFADVITVGATSDTDARASYSNYGTGLDLVAPVGDTTGLRLGSRTYLCYPNVDDCSNETNVNIFSDYSSESIPRTSLGTSFAAPQVSAAAALLRSLNGNLTPIQISNLLTANTTILGGNYNTNTGYGLLNLEKAVNYYTNVVASNSNPNFNPSMDGDNQTDLIAYRYLSTKTPTIDVTKSTGSNFGGGNLGFEVWNIDSGLNSTLWNILSPADVNGDGLLDIIAINKNTTQVNVLLSDGTSLGTGYLGAQIWNKNSGYDPINWEYMPPQDVNGDGKADLIAFNKKTTKVDVTLSDGLTFGGGNLGFQIWNQNSAYDLANWYLLNPSDVNGDGKADLIALNKRTPKVDVTLSTGINFGGGSLGFQIWNSNTGYDTLNWKILNLADVNNDRKADIIALNKKTTKIDVTLSTGINFGGGTLGFQVWNSNTGYNIYTWKMLKSSDVNGDGFADLIAFHPATTKVAVTLSNGSNFGSGYAGSIVWNNNTGFDTINWKLLNNNY